MNQSNPNAGLLSLLPIWGPLTVTEPPLRARELKPTRKFSPQVAERKWRLRKGKGLAHYHSAGCRATAEPGGDLLLHGPRWDPHGYPGGDRPPCSNCREGGSGPAVTDADEETHSGRPPASLC